MPILLFAIFIAISFFYFVDYYIKKDLNFTDEDKFLFVLFVVVFLTFLIVYIFLIFDRAKLINLINKMKKEMVEIEDNCILVNRDTQEIILNYYEEDK